MRVVILYYYVLVVVLHWCTIIIIGLINRRLGMKTKKQYEQYLNEIGNEMSLDELRARYCIGTHTPNRDLGTFLRRYDPIQFEVGFNEFEVGFNEWNS